MRQPVNKATGRSETVQLFHASEVAHWPNAEEHFAGAMQAVAGAPGTELILESTANGLTNIYHQLWARAERGELDLMPVFVPWFWCEDYEQPVESGWQPPPKWEEYGRLHQLGREQLYWAFCQNKGFVLRDGGTVEVPSAKFKPEYPGTANEAFETSGENMFIPPEDVLKARKAQIEGHGPVIVGVDPAYGGKDKTAIIDRQGRRSGGHFCEVRDFGRVGLDMIVNRLQAIAQILVSRGVAGFLFVIDATGGDNSGGMTIAAKLADRIPSKYVQTVEFSRGAGDSNAYANLRAEMWDQKVSDPGWRPGPGPGRPAGG